MKEKITIEYEIGAAYIVLTNENGHTFECRTDTHDGEELTDFLMSGKMKRLIVIKDCVYEVNKSQSFKIELMKKDIIEAAQQNTERYYEKEDILSKYLEDNKEKFKHIGECILIF